MKKFILTIYNIINITTKFEVDFLIDIDNNNTFDGSQVRAVSVAFIVGV